MNRHQKGLEISDLPASKQASKQASQASQQLAKTPALGKIADDKAT